MVLQLSGNHGDVGRSRIELLWQFHHQLHNRWVLEERVHERMPSWAGTKGSHNQKVRVISHWHGIFMKETSSVLVFHDLLDQHWNWKYDLKIDNSFPDSYSFRVTALDRGSPASIDQNRTGGWKCSLQLLLHTWLMLPIRSSNLGESFISLLVLHFCTHRLVVLEPLQTLEEVVTSLEPYLRSLWAGGSWLLHTAGLCKAQKRLMWRTYHYKQWWLLH